MVSGIPSELGLALLPRSLPEPTGCFTGSQPLPAWEVSVAQAGPRVLKGPGFQPLLQRLMGALPRGLWGGEGSISVSLMSSGGARG